MRSVGQILSIQIFDYGNIKNLSIKYEPSRLILRGESVCKIFEFIKGVKYEVMDSINAVNVVLDINTLNNSELKKHIDVINMISSHINYQNNKAFWLRSLNGCEVNSIKNIFSNERKIGYNTHTLHNNENIILGNNVYSKIEVNENNKSQIKLYQKANTKINVDKKALGGIIFDNNFSFLEDFCNVDSKGSKGSKNKNIIIADSLPKSYDFLQINSLNKNTDLTNKRIILYYPTDHIINNMIIHIKNGLVKPSLIWIVFPKQSSMFDYKDIINILFWTSETFACNNGLNLITLNYNKLVSNESDRIVEIERVKYNLGTLESELIKSTTDAQLLDKFYFSNIGIENVCNLYNTKKCPICIKKINNFAYFKCGHAFCSCCSFETCKATMLCPLCREVSKTYPNISNLELTKMTYLKKLLSKLIETKNEMDNILIYVDNQLISKGLLKWLKIYFKEIPSNIANKRKVYLKKTLIICGADNFYISKNIKNVSEVISISTNHDFILNSESLGYDYFFANKKVRLWLFDYVSE